MIRALLGIAGILRQVSAARVANACQETDHGTSQSAHPAVLFCLYFFRTAAIAVYILCGFFISNYVLSVSPSPHYKSSSMLKAFMSIR